MPNRDTGYLTHLMEINQPADLQFYNLLKIETE